CGRSNVIQHLFVALRLWPGLELCAAVFVQRRRQENLTHAAEGVDNCLAIIFGVEVIGTDGRDRCWIGAADMYTAATFRAQVTHCSSSALFRFQVALGV